ncbi:MAG: pyruvate kinase [Rhodospirillaceae bacterium]|jgi:pyruvate kinase|nr:pyruvate kinase [Rhodospirillaceae bacterium]MDC0998707.1 pyruvate kinase [Alphaproteobacteria bacterium]MBT5911196.1 pyruvate kinase [Rhodospirillaceae bacterium]MBT6304682.1 pyruvate kinase [Rhodospirillaceae bacterium]MBT7732642.1 pyruvate kinase [Rhodospirillaceae bacterium]
MRRYRNTKIVATLGPASTTKKQIRALIKAGVDVFRLNFSHGSHEDHQSRFETIRQLEEELDRPIAIMADLQGPKLRVGVFKSDEVELAAGASFVLDLEDALGSNNRVQLPHQEIFDAAVVGMELLLDDGKIRLRVQNAAKNSIETKVITGGTLSNRKGVNVPGVALGLSSLSEKDKIDLNFALQLGFDWIALSFVQRPADVAEARELIKGRASVLIKLEKPAAIEHLDELVKLSDAVMVARGDLGVELPPEKVPGIQKKIVKLCRHWGKPVVVATQMLDSMVHAPAPTRAEASDVATAVYDSADAVMLSAETAAGEFPLESVDMMNRIILEVEGDEAHQILTDEKHEVPEPTVSDAITLAARQVAQTVSASCIITYTTSGSTTLRAARERPSVPILCVTSSIATARRLAMAWGVHSVHIAEEERFSAVVRRALDVSKSQGFAESGDQIVITAGVPMGKPGSTNVLRIERVP